MLWALTHIEYPDEKPARHESMWASLRGGFAYLHENKQMLMLMWMTVAASLFGIPFLTFIPYFAKVQLNAGESGLGWLLAASGFGAVLGAMTVAIAGMIRHRGRVLTVAGVIFFWPSSDSANRAALRSRSVWHSSKAIAGS